MSDIKSIQKQADNTTLISGRVRFVTEREGQHYMVFGQPSAFDQIERLTHQLRDAGITKENTTGAPWPQGRPVLGMRDVYVPYNPRMVDVRDQDNVTFAFKKLATGTQVADIKVTHRPDTFQRFMNGDRNAYAKAPQSGQRTL